MSVHYKFKSTLDYDTITFDGLHISVADLKKAILQQKRLSKITDFDLQIINAQTKEEYQHESSLIPKNTSLIISRVPVANQAKKSWDTAARPVQPRLPSKVESAELDLSKMEGSEEDKIQAMMLQSTAEYDPKSYQKIRGYAQTGEVPASYKCNKCKKGGHWIKNCPYTISKEYTIEKRTTGIPKSFRDKDERALMVDSQEAVVEEDKKQEIPDDLICAICNDLFIDAVMIPCCGSSFCDDCVRTALLESEDSECPDCKEKGSSPGSLIPNRFLRNSVNAFKNRTGYKASGQAKKELDQQSVEVVEKKQREKSIEKEEANHTVEEKISTEIERQVKDELGTKVMTTAVLSSVEEPCSDIKKETFEIKHKTANTISSPANEDSDYEDNIIVTVPSASDTRTEKYLGRRHVPHPKPPGIDQNSPKSKHQVSPYHSESNSYKQNEHAVKDWDHSPEEKIHDNTEVINNEHYLYEKSIIMPPLKPLDNVQPPGANSMPVPVYPHPPYDMQHQQQQRPIRPINIHPGFHNHIHRPTLYPHPNMPPHHPPHQMRLPMPPINSYDSTYNPIGNVAPGYQRFPTTILNRFSYPIREPEGANLMRPFNSIASVYEEVAAKVGIGIIDDPLEAFNRIMKEKEKKKDERRSPDRRRRSKERHIRGNFRTSPYNNRIKDHGYYRGRSRERDMDRRWPRYGKPLDKDRERERDRERLRERECDREREREKDQIYRTRRSKSFDRSSRSRSNSPSNRRYKSPQTSKPHSTHEMHQHHHHSLKFKTDEHSEEDYNRQKRNSGRSLPPNISKPLDSRGGNRHLMDQVDKNMELRRSYNIIDENSEPPPPGFEVQPSRNPFLLNNTSMFPSTIRERDRSLCNNTPDLYEKCVSQDMEENKFYKISSGADHKSKSRTASRSRSRSQCSLKISEKRRKIHRSTTPKGKPNDDHLERDKDNILTGRSYSHSTHKNEERYSKNKDKKLNDHESRRRSLTPPTQKNVLSDQRHTSSETDHKDKSDSKKSDKKLKDRKKKRRDKSERKKLKKEKKSKKERHRLKSDEKDNLNKEGENLDLTTIISSIENKNEQEDKSANEFSNQNQKQKEDLVKYLTMEKDLCAESPTKKEPIGLLSAAKSKRTPKKQHPITTEHEEKTPTSSDIKCFDAVLDIHEYETDFDDTSCKLQDNSNKLVPDASKWELEDQPSVAVQSLETKIDGLHTQNHSDIKVTNDVIVRAEKAIFARAINAIRPIEIRTKSVSKERSSKCFSDDHENIQNIQITLPVNINKDRSIEMKTELTEKKKSIKERLGSKISQPIYSQLAESNRRDLNDHTYKSSFGDNERGLNNDRNRDRRKKSNADNNNKDNSNVKKSESDKNYRERQGKNNNNRDRSHNKEKDRGDKDSDRSLGRGDNDKERERHREKNIIDNKDREYDNAKHRERIKEHHKPDSVGSGLHSRSKDYKTLSKTEREHRDHHDINKKRTISTSNSDTDDEDRKRKLSKGEKKTRKRSESLDSDSGKKSNKKKNKADKKKKKKSKK